MAKRIIKARWVGTVQIDLEIEADAEDVRPLGDIRRIITRGVYLGNVKRCLQSMVSSGESENTKSSVNVNQTYADAWLADWEEEDGKQV